MHHLLGYEQKKVAQLWRPVYRGLPLEQTHESLSQHRAVVGHPRPALYKKLLVKGDEITYHRQKKLTR